jgi:hypothetical protein
MGAKSERRMPCVNDQGAVPVSAPLPSCLVGDDETDESEATKRGGAG